MNDKYTILGDGGWGTAIALLLAGKNFSVTLWGHDPDYLSQMKESRKNSTFLPGFELPDNIFFEPDMACACANTNLIIEAIPTKFLRSSLAANPNAIPCEANIVSLTKGVEQKTLKRPSEIIAEACGCKHIAVLSGPSHAEEVAKKLPASVTVASSDKELAKKAQDILMAEYFRVYTSTDVIGVELGGALKNVIALAAGIATGLKLGDNALAALITRGLAEITRLGAATGADVQTFSGLSGMGDLVTTCFSPFGRNRTVGIELASGKSLEQILSEKKTVAEGVTTASGALDLARKLGVEMPITEQICNVLYEGKHPREAVVELMTRSGKAES